MQSRRKFVKAMVAGGALATAGCLGYELVPESEIESRDSTIAEQRAEIRELEFEVEAVSTDAEAYRAEAEDFESEFDRIRREAERQRERRVELEDEVEDLETEPVFVAYRYGYLIAEHGTDEYTGGVDLWNDSDHLAAMRAFERGFTFFRAAVAAFEDSDSKGRELGRDRISRFTDDAVAYCAGMAEACDSLGRASENIIAGDSDAASDHYDAAIESLNVARESTIPDPEAVETEL